MKTTPNAENEARIYRKLFDAVMSQQLTPGTRLAESALCELFGASRGVVRKVLQRLAHDQLVSIEPNRGARVAAPTPQETRQVFEARRCIESALVELAVTHATRADIQRLRKHLRCEHDSVHRLGQPAWVQLASQFHFQVAALGRNTVLQRYLTELITRCSLIVALYEVPGNSVCEHHEHEHIVDAIELGNAKKAVQLMNAHLQVLEQRIDLNLKPGTRSLADILGVTGA